MSEPRPDSLSAVVDLIEPMGHETLLHMLAGEQDLRVVVDHRVAVTPGETLHLRFSPSQTHVFDEAEKALR